MPIRRRTLAILLLATLIPAGALAQEVQPGMVPMELARALIPDFMGDGSPPDILVGRMPEQQAAVIPVPDGVRVVGSTVGRRSIQSVLAVPTPAQPVLDAMIAELRAAGWSEAPRFPYRGFVSSAAVEPTGLCGAEGDVMYLSVRPGPGEEELLTIHHIVDPRSTPCEVASPRRSVMDELPMPALLPPAGVRVQGGFSGGVDEGTAQGQLSTELGVEEIARHYAEQLRGHGWQSSSRVAAPGLVVETWAMEDDEGTAWHGMLVLSELPQPGQREAFLRLRRAP